MPLYIKSNTVVLNFHKSTACFPLHSEPKFLRNGKSKIENYGLSNGNASSPIITV